MILLKLEETPSEVYSEILNLSCFSRKIAFEIIGISEIIKEHIPVEKIFTSQSFIDDFLNAGADPCSPVIKWWEQTPKDTKWAFVDEYIKRSKHLIQDISDWTILSKMGFYNTNTAPVLFDILNHKSLQHWTIVSGSMLYDMNVPQKEKKSFSDFDFITVSNSIFRHNQISGEPLQSNSHSPCIRTFTVGSWLNSLRRGERIAWEILTSQNMTACKTLVENDIGQLTILQVYDQIEKRGHRSLLSEFSWREMSHYYFKSMWNLVKKRHPLDIFDLPDKNILDYTLGSFSRADIYAHKGHYYILIDAIISSWAEEHDEFSPTKPFQDPILAKQVELCKRGSMKKIEWVEIMSQYASAECMNTIYKDL